MEMLVSWLTQIIIFILLAIIIELFVPSSHMAKYVRLIIGLIFLLIFLQPILYLFKIDIEKVVNQSLFQEVLNREEIQQIEKIDQQKEVLQASNDAYILTEMSDQLKKQAVDVAEKHLIRITNIEYEFAHSKINLNDLERLIVYIESRSISDSAEIVDVDEIVIDIDRQELEVDQDKILRIKEDLVMVWQLDEEDLIVKWGDHPS